MAGALLPAAAGVILNHMTNGRKLAASKERIASLVVEKDTLAVALKAKEEEFEVVSTQLGLASTERDSLRGERDEARAACKHSFLAARAAREERDQMEGLFAAMEAQRNEARAELSEARAQQPPPVQTVDTGVQTAQLQEPQLADAAIQTVEAEEAPQVDAATQLGGDAEEELLAEDLGPEAKADAVARGRKKLLAMAQQEVRALHRDVAAKDRRIADLERLLKKQAKEAPGGRKPRHRGKDA